MLSAHHRKLTGFPAIAASRFPVNVTKLLKFQPHLLVTIPHEQGQLETARARLSGRGVGGDAATAAFATAVSKVVAAVSGALGQEDGGSRALSRLKSSSEGVLEAIQEPPATAAGAAAAATAMPADVAAREVRERACSLRCRLVFSPPLPRKPACVSRYVGEQGPAPLPLPKYCWLGNSTASVWLLK